MTIFKLPKFAEKIADKSWNHVMVWALRVVIGCVFMFSGLAKAIDPWGGYYKVMEYCHVYGFESFANAALGLSFSLSALEFMLGVCVLLGAFRRGAPALMLCMMAVMLPLTLDLAITDRVPHCGCFGDAVVLSNWATFFKNVALTVGLVYLLSFNRRVHGLVGPAVNWVAGLLSLLFVLAVGYNGYFKQPLVDFSPYKVGSKIGIPANIDGEDEDYVFVYEKNGEKQEFGIDNLPDEDNGWTFVERRFKEGRQPKGRVITQAVSVYDNGVDVTEDVLPDTGRVVMILFPDLRGVNISYSFNLNEIYTHATQQGIGVIAASPATGKDVAWWNDISMAEYRTYLMDDSELKSIARGNPAVVYVENGVIKWKRTLASLNNDQVRDPQARVADFNADYDRKGTFSKLLWALVLSLLALVVVNRVPVLVVKKLRKPKKEEQKEEQEEEQEEEQK